MQVPFRLLRNIMSLSSVLTNVQIQDSQADAPQTAVGGLITAFCLVGGSAIPLRDAWIEIMDVLINFS